MRKTLLTVAVIAIAQLCYAQWTNVSGTGDYYLNSGNVSIGTTPVTNSVLQVSKTFTGASGNTFGIGSFYTQANGGYTAGSAALYGEAIFEGTGNTNGNFALVSGVWGRAVVHKNATNNITDVIGVFGVTAGPDDGPGASTTVTNVIGVKGAPMWNTAKIITNMYGGYFYGGSNVNVANQYGVYISNSPYYNTSSYGLYVTGENKNYFSGKVGIGTTDPQGYMLAVNGSTIATSVTVKLYASWPDYVFKKGYKLPSLLEVKAYVDKNHHLQDMPSEQEVAKDGINLGEIVKLQTKKIEELTLYLIEQDKQMKVQQKVNESLQDQINQLARKSKESN